MNGEINFEFVKDKDWDVVQRFLVPKHKDKQSLGQSPVSVGNDYHCIILGILQHPDNLVNV